MAVQVEVHAHPVIPKMDPDALLTMLHLDRAATTATTAPRTMYAMVRVVAVGRPIAVPAPAVVSLVTARMVRDVFRVTLRGRRVTTVITRQKTMCVAVMAPVQGRPTAVPVERLARPATPRMVLDALQTTLHPARAATMEIQGHPETFAMAAEDVPAKQPSVETASSKPVNSAMAEHAAPVPARTYLTEPAAARLICYFPALSNNAMAGSAEVPTTPVLGGSTAASSSAA